MGRLRARAKDKRVLAGEGVPPSRVLTEYGDREDTWAGTPQGGILSPLLANLAVTRAR